MKVQRIDNTRNYKNNNKLAFQGTVNGKYYEDWVIAKAKATMHNSNWKDEFLKRKKNVTQTLEQWHENLDVEGPKTTRVLMGIMSLGVTEVGYGLLSLFERKQDNEEIAREIEEISNCIADLWREQNKNR